MGEAGSGSYWPGKAVNIMQTEVLKVTGDMDMEKLLKHPAITRAARLLRAGEVVAFPTETVYGLGGDALNPSAVKKIFAAKGRPADNPLIVHLGRVSDLDRVIAGRLDNASRQLIKQFWPGPLTIIFRRGAEVPDITTSGLKTVAVRMPSLPVTRAIIRTSGLVLAAPSANSSGLPSPTRAEHVLLDLEGKIPLIIDGGESPIGLESTVIDLTGEKPAILRPGQITWAELEEVLGCEVIRDFKKHEANNNSGTSSGVWSEESGADSSKPQFKPRSPGMKYRHYAPKTTTSLLERGTPEDIFNFLKGLDYSWALLASRETVEYLERLEEQSKSQAGFSACGKNFLIKDMGSRSDIEQIARHLFSFLRELDKQDFSEIFVEALPAEGLGEAVMNRLAKAASRRIDFSCREEN